MTTPYTLTDAVRNVEQFDGIQSALRRVVTYDLLLPRLHGKCIAASDIIQNILGFYGVKSRTMECETVIVKDNPDNTKDFCFVGLNDFDVETGKIDTHVVVVTETNPPVLIDASLGHMLPESDQIVVRELMSKDPEVLGQFQLSEGTTLIYNKKKNIKFPALHQRNLVERMRLDQVIDKKISFLQKVVIAIICFSFINFTLNMITLYMKVMFGT